MERIKDGIMQKLIIALALVALVDGQRKSYRGYKVYVVTPTTDKQLKLLKKMSNGTEYSFWSDPVGTNISMDIMVPPQKIRDFEKSMNETGTPHEVSIEDLQLLHDEQRGRRRRPRSPGRHFDWNDFYGLEEINGFLESMIKKYPKLVMRRSLTPKSSEGRIIKGVKLSFKENNPGVFIEGGIHAREWISPATVTYVLHEFLTSNDPNIKKLAQSYNWYFFPVVNPDGYHYSRQEDRLWRKSRKKRGECIGTDLNRNWGYHWSKGGPGADLCQETYSGEKAFSDPETIALSHYIKTISKKLYAYISFHSFRQMILIPYAYTKEHSNDYKELHAIAEKAIAALEKRYGTKYKTGTASETLKIMHGTSTDWVKGTFNTPLTYTYELRDKHRYGFELPSDQIIPTGEETIDSLVALFEEADKRGTLKKWLDSQIPPNSPRRWHPWAHSNNVGRSHQAQLP